MDSHIFRFCDNEMLSRPEQYTQGEVGSPMRFNPKPLADAYWAEFGEEEWDDLDEELDGEGIRYSEVLREVINWYWKAPIAFQYELADLSAL